MPLRDRNCSKVPLRKINHRMAGISRLRKVTQSSQLMSHLTTHVLDISHGKPAAGMRITLVHGSTTLKNLITNVDGRCDEPLLTGDETPLGSLELRFHVREYFESMGISSPFLNVVSICFEMEADQSYHVPLLCSPWSYSTYRGS